MIKARSPYYIEHEEPAAPAVLNRFTCEDTVISGLAVAANGTITNPTASVGTFHSVEPSSFGTVTTDTVRNVVVYVTYDSSKFRPPTDSSDEIGCTVQVTQPATVTPAHCKTYRVTNNSSTENGLLNYIACDGQQTITYTIPPSTSVDICVYPFNTNTFGFPTVSGDVTYFDLVQGCTTDTLS